MSEDLAALSEASLFRAMDRAYGQQAYVVDNCGSDDASYAAEQRCNRLEAEIKRRGLTATYNDRRDQ